MPPHRERQPTARATAAHAQQPARRVPRWTSRRAYAALAFALLLLWELAGFGLRRLEENAAAAAMEGAASVPTFAYDALRSGRAVSPLRAEGTGRFQEIPFPAGAEAQSHMPLYVNGSLDRVSGAEGRSLLLFGARGSRFVAHDLGRARTHWSIALGEGNVSSAPVVDPVRGRVYFLARRSWRDDRARDRPPRNGHDLYSVGLDGEGLQRIELDLPALLGIPPDSRSYERARMAFCKTAIGLYETADAHYVFQGCSVTSDYGRARGVRGLLIAVDLDDSGRFREPTSLRTFSPTPPTDDPRTGYDAGIWNAGSTPGILPDGSLLVATGNGPLVPEEANYGCSVVRLDGRTLEPRAKRPGDPVFYSRDAGGHQECWALNRDLAASAVASIETEGRIRSVIAGKDAHLRLLDPEALPGSDPAKRVEVAGVGKRGQPVLFEDADGRVLVFAAGRQLTESLPRESVLAADDPARGADAEVNHVACLGLVADRPAADTVPLDRYFSGPLRRDAVVLPADAKTTALIQRTWNEFEQPEIAISGNGLWSPYLRGARVGHAYRKDAVPPAGFALHPLRVFFRADRAGLFSLPADFAEAGNASGAALLEGAVAVEETSIALLAPVDAPPGAACGESAPAGHRFLHLYDWIDRGWRPNGWGVASFEITRDGTLERRWTHDGDMAFRPHTMSPVVTATREGRPGLVFFAVRDVDDPDASALLVFDAATGRLVDRVSFVGAPHFTMPLVVGERVYVSTRDHGIKLFARRHWAAALARSSPLARVLGWALSGHAGGQEGRVDHREAVDHRPLQAVAGPGA